MSNTKEQISRNMRSNRSKDTKPEIMLRHELWRRGLRYRKNYKYLSGKPDIVFLGAKTAVFVDGRMWRRYEQKYLSGGKRRVLAKETRIQYSPRQGYKRPIRK